MRGRRPRSIPRRRPRSRRESTCRSSPTSCARRRRNSSSCRSRRAARSSTSAYAKVAAAAGLTREQAVRIYAFESGGNGKYDVQAGLEYPRPDARAISTALGYNQLSSTNSVELLAGKGENFVKALQAKGAALSGEGLDALARTLAGLKAI